MLRTYKYRLLPTLEQQEKLEFLMGCCRFVYNLGLETKIHAWSSVRKNLSCYDLIKQLTELKKIECKWLAECNSQCLESSLTNLDKAYKSFFKGGGFPKFKKKSNRQSVQFRQYCKIVGASIRLGKIGFVDFIKHRELPDAEIRTVTVLKTPSNKYFVSILIKDNKQVPTPMIIDHKTTVGVDLGLKSFAVLSDGTEYSNQRFLKSNLKRLRIEQRKLRRRFKNGVKTPDQSNGWHKQRLVVALLHEKIANQRSDFLHKVSTSITKRYDTICLEDLNITAMAKNRRLSKDIADVSWGQFSMLLKYKASWYGKNLIFIDRFAPSSKTCSNCGEVFNALKLSDRTWICQSCGVEHDRDHNAAKNIKTFGLQTEPSTANVSQWTERIGCKPNVAI